MKNVAFAPVLLFAYKRPDTLQQAVYALQQNSLARESDLFVFSDAAKSGRDEQKVAQVREYIRTIGGFRNIIISEAKDNKGLARSVIDGVTRVIGDFGKVIVLEDDLVTSSNFLSYMNQCLEHYERNPAVYSISGYSFPLKRVAGKDVYFTKRGCSWGWATWKKRWEKVDWSVPDYDNCFKSNPEQKRAFNRMGSDLSSMLRRQMEGKLNSWAIRWCYHQFRKDLYTVYPTVSKVRNIGFTREATHTVEFFNRYDTVLDRSERQHFYLEEPHIDKDIMNGFLSRYSLSSRIRYKLLNTFAALFSK